MQRLLIKNARLILLAGIGWILYLWMHEWFFPYFRKEHIDAIIKTNSLLGNCNDSLYANFRDYRDRQHQLAADSDSIHIRQLNELLHFYNEVYSLQAVGELGSSNAMHKETLALLKAFHRNTSRYLQKHQLSVPPRWGVPDLLQVYSQELPFQGWYFKEALRQAVLMEAATTSIYLANQLYPFPASQADLYRSKLQLYVMPEARIVEQGGHYHCRLLVGTSIPKSLRNLISVKVEGATSYYEERNLAMFTKEGAAIDFEPKSPLINGPGLVKKIRTIELRYPSSAYEPPLSDFLQDSLYIRKRQ